MNPKDKLPTKPEPHMEKQVMDQPQEEFVADQSVPSRDISDAGDRPKAPENLQPPTRRD